MTEIDISYSGTSGQFYVLNEGTSIFRLQYKNCSVEFKPQETKEGRILIIKYKDVKRKWFIVRINELKKFFNRPVFTEYMEQAWKIFPVQGVEFKDFTADLSILGDIYPYTLWNDNSGGGCAFIMAHINLNFDHLDTYKLVQIIKCINKAFTLYTATIKKPTKKEIEDEIIRISNGDHEVFQHSVGFPF